MSRRRLAWPATLILLLALAPGAEEVSARSRRPNILLITVESLRRDRLGCYAGDGKSTPAIDALAARGVRFERAYAASPSTVPSVATILTGLYPGHHGIRHDLGGRLRDDAPTLAAMLGRKGYRTAAVIGSFHLDSDRGLDPGFGSYDDEIPGVRKMVGTLSKERRAEEVVKKGLEFLDGRKKDRPFFLWLDLYDPHYDYDPPDPFKKQFESDLYEGEVAYVDTQVGALLEGLRARGLQDETHVVLVGSHGEGLGDHGETGHGTYLYETTIRVPLIVVVAGSGQARGVRSAGTDTEVSADRPSGRRSTQLVGLVDLAPTLLDLADVAAQRPLDGRSLAPLLRGDGGGQTPIRPYFVEAVQPREAYGWSPLFAVVEGSRKVVEGQRIEAFDLEGDPGEGKPIVPPPGWAAELIAGSRAQRGQIDLPEEERQKIRLEAAALHLPWDSSPICLEKQDGPDPRDRAALNDALFKARVDYDQDVKGRASTAAQEVLESDPGNFTALELVSFLALRNGWPDVLLSHLEVLQCNYPFRGTSYHFFGHQMQKQGELAKAEGAFRMFARLEPRSEEPYYDLAAVYAEQGKKDLAFSHLKQAIALGATDFGIIRSDPRLSSLRDDPRFSELVPQPAPPPSKRP